MGVIFLHPFLHTALNTTEQPAKEEKKDGNVIHGTLDGVGRFFSIQRALNQHFACVKLKIKCQIDEIR